MGVTYRCLISSTNSMSQTFYSHKALHRNQYIAKFWNHSPQVRLHQYDTLNSCEAAHLLLVSMRNKVPLTKLTLTPNLLHLIRIQFCLHEEDNLGIIRPHDMLKSTNVHGLPKPWTFQLSIFIGSGWLTPWQPPIESLGKH